MSLKIGSNQISPIQIDNVINNQSNKTVTPTKSAQTITQDTGYDGLTQVTVNSIPASYIIPTGTLVIGVPGIIYAKQYASVSIPGMANPTWNTTTITSNTGKINYSINLPSGFKSTSQSFSSSYTLPSVVGTTITPSETSQIAVNSYQWTKGSVIVNAIPNSITVYKKIIEKTVNCNELNEFLSSQSIIPSFAFMQTSTLSSGISNSTVTEIGFSAFYSCSKIIYLNFNNVTSIKSYAFAYCSSMTSANFNNVTRVEAYAFSRCYKLSNFSAPNLSIIAGYAFDYCSSLVTISFSNVTTLENRTFAYCINLETVYLPNVSKFTGEYNFSHCSKLTTISLPNLTYLFGSDFQSCFSLETISLPKLSVVDRYTSCFQACSKLKSIYLMNSTMVYVSTATYENWQIFDQSPVVSSSYLGGVYASIYVPASLLTTYQNNSGWAPIAARFVGI